jgi:hypothetical protein
VHVPSPPTGPGTYTPNSSSKARWRSSRSMPRVRRERPRLDRAGSGGGDAPRAASFRDEQRPSDLVKPAPGAAAAGSPETNPTGAFRTNANRSRRHDVPSNSRRNAGSDRGGSRLPARSGRKPLPRFRRRETGGQLLPRPRFWGKDAPDSVRILSAVQQHIAMAQGIEGETGCGSTTRESSSSAGPTWSVNREMDSTTSGENAIAPPPENPANSHAPPSAVSRPQSARPPRAPVGQPRPISCRSRSTNTRILRADPQNVRNGNDPSTLERALAAALLPPDYVKKRSRRA